MINFQKLQYVGWKEGTPPPTSNQKPKTTHFLLKFEQRSLLFNPHDEQQKRKKTTK
jgi:hypothetical protein